MSAPQECKAMPSVNHCMQRDSSIVDDKCKPKYFESDNRVVPRVTFPPTAEYGGPILGSLHNENCLTYDWK